MLIVAVVVIEHVPGDARVAPRPDRLNALDGEELLLEPDLVTGVAGERAGRADDAVTGHDDRQRIPAQGLRDRARRRGLADLGGDPGVRRDRAVRDRGRRAQDRAVEVAARQPQVERPLQTRAIAAQIFHELAVERLDLGAVLLQLDPGDPTQPRRAQIDSAVEVLDERHPVLRARDENPAERRGEHTVGHQARFQIGEPRLQSLPRAGHAFGRRRRASERAHDALDLAIAVILAAAGAARVDVLLDATCRSGLGVARRRGDEVRFDLHAYLRFTLHRGRSMLSGLSEGGAPAPRRSVGPAGDAPRSTPPVGGSS